MKVSVAAVLLICLGLVWGRPEPEPQIEVEEIEEIEDPEVTEGYFEGDIDLKETRNAIRYPNRLWPNGIVYYHISSAFSYSTRQLILAAMREIESDTKHGSQNCIRYVERTTQHDYIDIQKNTGCHSKIGRVGGAQELSIGHGCEMKGIIVHELNHALGFWHEQNRYDRDTYVTVHLNNVAHANQNNFAKHTTRDMMTLGTPYDYGSIMHYSAYTFAIDRTEPTISPTPHHANPDVIMGQRLAMSAIDVTRVQKLYHCTVDTSHITHPATTNSIVQCNFESGMCGLVQDTHDDFDWTRKIGGTPTANTGPNADHSTSLGYYLYAEASSHIHKTARLMTKTVDAGNYCLDLFLFMKGAQEGYFQILAAGTSIHEQILRTVSQHVDRWGHLRLNINVPRSFHLILQATIGPGSLSDIAIDDLRFYRGRCV